MIFDFILSVFVGLLGVSFIFYILRKGAWK